ncbi:MAG TPA: hypothetical protein VG722_00515, partial [Tepidisphaeraceae bacterium]|nr:hypothetical protein [Tepidisphaeraceae bacterium]
APEIVIDFGRPTKMDEWAPQIVEWRRNNVPWKEIAQRTGLKMANAYTAYRRYIESTKAA